MSNLLETMLENKTADLQSALDHIAKLIARIAELEGVITASDKRLSDAGERCDIVFGCDTADVMADEIIGSRTRITELEAELTLAVDKRNEMIGI